MSVPLSGSPTSLLDALEIPNGAASPNGVASPTQMGGSGSSSSASPLSPSSSPESPLEFVAQKANAFRPVATDDVVLVVDSAPATAATASAGAKVGMTVGSPSSPSHSQGAKTVGGGNSAFAAANVKSSPMVLAKNLSAANLMHAAAGGMAPPASTATTSTASTTIALAAADLRPASPTTVPHDDEPLPPLPMTPRSATRLIDKVKCFKDAALVPGWNKLTQKEIAILVNGFAKNLVKNLANVYVAICQNKVGVFYLTLNHGEQAVTTLSVGPSSPAAHGVLSRLVQKLATR